MGKSKQEKLIQSLQVCVDELRKQNQCLNIRIQYLLNFVSTPSSHEWVYWVLLLLFTIVDAILKGDTFALVFVILLCTIRQIQFSFIRSKEKKKEKQAQATFDSQMRTLR